MPTLILTCSTGQGHNSCADALQEYYELQQETCAVKNALNFVSPAFSNFICWGHTTIYRHLHGLFQIGYGYSERHSGMFREDSGIYKILARGADPLCRCIREGNYDTVICTHVFASLIMTEVQKRYHLPVSIGLVSTDYTCNPGTKESRADLYFIADPPLSVHYECPDIEDSQIVYSGIPIRQMFYRNTDRENAGRTFGIPQGHQHLLMMCGSMGCGPMKALTEKFSRMLPEGVDLTIVCGTNSALEKKLSARYASNSNIHILGYVEDISCLMDSADLYLTKPGGISVTEAASKNLPMVFIDAVAGCEEYNKIYFIKKGAAKTGATVREIADICVGLMKNPARLAKMRASLQSCQKINASSSIYSAMKSCSEEKQNEPAHANC